MRSEYWVARVVAPATRDALAETGVAERIARGTLFVSGDEICEPIEVYDEQARAMERMGAEASRHPACTFKLVLSADLD